MTDPGEGSQPRPGQGTSPPSPHRHSAQGQSECDQHDSYHDIVTSADYRRLVDAVDRLELPSGQAASDQPDSAHLPTTPPTPDEGREAGPVEPPPAPDSDDRRQDGAIATEEKATGTPTSPGHTRLNGHSGQDLHYPHDLNPFGDCEEGEEEVSTSPIEPRREVSHTTGPSHTDLYPDTLNPFGESGDCHSPAGASLNPFEDEESESLSLSSISTTSSQRTPQPTPRASLQRVPPGLVCRESPTPPRSRHRKGKAPAPPSVPLSAEQCQADTPSMHSLVSNHSPNSSSPLVTCRTPTPVPRRSKARAQETAPSASLTDQISLIKSKKRPAPPIPAFKRAIKSTLAEIEAELEEICAELPRVETSCRHLEEWLLNNPATPEECSEDPRQKKLAEFLELAQRRCQLAQKQEELTYMKREQRLEERQAEVEFELRVIMSKQDAQKSEEDRSQEECLLGQLMEVVEERNQIIEHMIRDENKQIQQYHKLISEVVPSDPPPDSAGQSAPSQQTHPHMPKSLFRFKGKKKKAREGQEGHSEPPSAAHQPAKSRSKLGRSTLKKISSAKSEVKSRFLSKRASAKESE